MKQFFLIVAALVSIATGAKADVIINSTNFPDDNFSNYLLNLRDGRDGKFVWEELYGTRVINVNDLAL